MLRSSAFPVESLGTLSNLEVSQIIESRNNLRGSFDSTELNELFNSIRTTGLLTPILVRALESGKFETIAGNRRLKACKRLGWKKIPSYIVELDDKHAFEVSMIENIQRRTLTIIEEATAFRRYVNEFGWGGVTELAKILSKSPSYVSKRIRLLDLPKSIQDMIGESKISVSNGEELLLLNENTKCSQLEMLVEDKALSSKELRRVIKDQKNSLDPTDDIVFYSKLDEKKERILKSFDKSIIALRIALGRLGSNIETVEDDWTIFEILMNHKNIINAQIDLLFRERRKYLKTWQKFR